MSTPISQPMPPGAMYVIKRNGERERMQFDKITARLDALMWDLDKDHVFPELVAQKINSTLFPGVKTSEVDELAAEAAGYMIPKHPDYAILAARILVSNLHKQTPSRFSEAMEQVHAAREEGFLRDDFMAKVMKHRKVLDAAIDHQQDFQYDFFAMQTLLKSYLNRDKQDKVVERPQYMLMRVALALNLESLPHTLQTYKALSQRLYTHATPTLFNAGRKEGALASCFVAGTSILTKKGPVDIEKVQLGDLVVTHTGQWKPVTQLHKNPLGGRTLFNLKCRYTDTIKVTGNHRFWTVTPDNLVPRWIRVDQMPDDAYVALPTRTVFTDFVPKIDLVKTLAESTFMQDHKIQLLDNDMMTSTCQWLRKKLNHEKIEKPVICNSQPSQPIKRYIDINEDFATFLGIWLGDGHLIRKRSFDNKIKRPAGVGITVDCRNDKMLKWLDEKIPQIFGVSPTHHDLKKQNIRQVLVNSAPIGAFFDYYYGHGFAEKHLHHSMYDWPAKLVESFVVGLMSSDGCFTSKGTLTVQLSNRALCEQIYHLVRSIGQPMTFLKRNKTSKLATCEAYLINPPADWIEPKRLLKYYPDDRLNTVAKRDISVSKGKNDGKVSYYVIRHNGNTYTKVIAEKSTIQDTFPEYVYTLGVEDDHSYAAAGLVAENCYLSRIPDDSLEAIYDSVKQCALISKGAGGVGLAVHDIRAAGTLIKKSGGRSNGLVPMLKVFEATARYVDQCFHPSTIVYTKAGPKPIGDVAPLDKLVTSDGSFASVAKILHHPYQGPMLKILPEYTLAPMLPMSVTPLHPFFAVCPQDPLTPASLQQRLESGLLKPEFVEAEKLSTKDWIGFPIPQYEQDVPDYSLDDCRMWGIMLGCGVMATDTRKVEIFLDKKTQPDTLDFVINDYLAKLCIHPEIIDEDNHNCTVRWVAPVTCKFNAYLLFDQNNESVVAPHLLHLPVPKISALLRGFLEAHSQEYDHNIHVITTRETMQSWRYILFRLGVLASGYYSRKEFFLTIPKVKVIADLLSLKETKTVSFVQHNGVLYSAIKEIQSSPYSGVAVDFEMNGKNKDYLTEFGTVHNGGNKRKGAFAIYLEPWHADVEAFLDLRKNTGIEQLRTRDLFTALWVPDLFMKRVENDENWSLFSPDSAPGLSLAYGEQFDALYTRYEEEKRALKVIKARTLWNAILDSQRNTGTPYIGYKDAVNRKSNQKNLGTIQCSNLCHEIVQYTSKEEVAVCNLASINLEAFVEERKDGPPVYNFDKLGQTVMLVVRNSNAVIDVTYYPVPEARHSNLQHRPIGVGVQNLAGAFFKMKMSFASEEAQKLNRNIFETMYYHAVLASAEEAERVGPYKTFPGSPMSQGMFQFDLWNVKPSDRYDFEALRARVVKTGVRNSLLIALMPTATTSQILGGFESFEPIPSNLFVRRTQAGEFIVVNKYLVQDLQKAGLWTPEVIKQLVLYKGSVQQIEAIPLWLRDIYKTVWEIPAKVQIDMSADRSPFVCQTQSLNIHMENVSDEKLTKMHFYGWKKGLKTGMYYLRTTPAADPIQFTVDQQLRLAPKKAAPAPLLATIALEEDKSASEEEQPLYCSLNSECSACHG